MNGEKHITDSKCNLDIYICRVNQICLRLCVAYFILGATLSRVVTYSGGASYMTNSMSASSPLHRICIVGEGSKTSFSPL